MHIKKLFLLSLTITSLLPMPVFASGVDKLVKFARKNGAMVNVNQGAIINDQRGSIMTAGSVIMRGPKPEELDPFKIQLPSFKFDPCTGSADFRFGGFSYLRSDEWMKFFKGVAKTLPNIGVHQLLKTVSPMMHDMLTYFETVARNINGLSLNQCSMAQSIAAGSFQKHTNGDQQICMAQGTASRTGSDLFKMTQDCKDNPDRHGKAGMDSDFKSQLGKEFNLVWKALSQSTGTSSTQDLKEMMMSISGTIIGKKGDDGQYIFTGKPSLVETSETLEKFIGLSQGNSTIEKYQCSDPVLCLNPTVTQLTLKLEETIYGHISKTLRGLVDKVYLNDGANLTEDEEIIIGFSTIPILGLMENEIINKTKPGDIMVRISEHMEVICYDVITSFLENMLAQVNNNVRALSLAQMTDMGVIKDFNDQLQQTRLFLSNARGTAFKRLQVVLAVKERLIQQEKSFDNVFVRFMQTRD